MKLGLFFDLRNPEPWARPWPELYGGTLDLLERAEELGCEAAWFTEHHRFADGYLPQPLTFLAAVAARTRTMRIGTAILLAALRPAPLVAEEAAVVDQLSGGRLELGIGAGYSTPEYELYDKDITRRYGALLLAGSGGIRLGGRRHVRDEPALRRAGQVGRADAHSQD